MTKLVYLLDRTTIDKCADVQRIKTATEFVLYNNPQKEKVWAEEERIYYFN